MKLIGISAPKKGGKTTFAEFIKTNIENNFQKRVKIQGYAVPLKETCMAIFGGERKLWFGTDDDKNTRLEYWAKWLGEDYSTSRKIMVGIGTKIFRQKFYDGIWILALNKKLMDLASSVDVLIIDDIRFENEADYVRRVTGQMIHVTRDNKQWTKCDDSEMGPGYGTGTDLKYDFTNLVDMKLAAVELSKHILKQKDIVTL